MQAITKGETPLPEGESEGECVPETCPLENNLKRPISLEERAGVGVKAQCGKFSREQLPVLRWVLNPVALPELVEVV